MQYWLMKSEGDCYSIDDLKRDKTSPWDGVRNYQARNFMQQMQVGDQILFYHSSAKPLGVYGIAKVARTAQPDETQFDTKSEYYEPRATKEKPVWYCVAVRFVKKFTTPLTLAEMKNDPALEGMLVRRPNRLSVQPVSQKHFEHIVSLRG